MADLPAISDANLYAAKSDDIPVPGGEETTHIGAADLNAIRARMAENRTQANTALSTANTALAAANGFSGFRSETAATPILPGDAGYLIEMIPSGSDLTVYLLDEAYVSTQRTIILRVVGDDVGGDVVLTPYAGTHVIFGPTRLVRGGSQLTLTYITLSAGTHYWVTKAEYEPYAPATHTGATLTLTAAHRNAVLRVSAASNAVAIEIPDTLPGAGTDLSDVWECQLDIVDGETNAVTISTGAGLLTPVYMGALNAITVDGTKVAIQVVRGAASVIIVEPYA